VYIARTLRRVAGRIEQGRVASGRVVAAKQRRPPAPTAAARDLIAILDDEIGAVGDQLGVQAHDLVRGLHPLRWQERLQQFANRLVHKG
jgi:hypothetical protein